MKKIVIPGGRFSQSTALPPERILCNDIILPHEYNPHKVKLWICFSAHGPMGAAWASSMEEAIDVLADNDLAGAVLLDPSEEGPHVNNIGNDGMPANLDDVACTSITFEPSKDWPFLCMLAEARGKGCDTLADL